MKGISCPNRDRAALSQCFGGVFRLTTVVEEWRKRFLGWRERPTRIRMKPQSADQPAAQPVLK